VEEVIFAVYLKRFRKETEMIEHLRSEHQVLAEETRELRHCVERILEGSICSREDVQTALAAYLAKQRKHLNRKEAEIFRRIDAVLKAERPATNRTTAPGLHRSSFSVAEVYQSLRTGMGLDRASRLNPTLGFLRA